MVALQEEWSEDLEAELMELESYEQDAEGFDAWIRRNTPRLPPPAHIKPLIDLWERTRLGPVYAVVEMPPRHAKRISDSCPVFTPGGWTTHGKLRPGHRVYASDGSIAEVTYRSPPGVCDLVVTFSDGEQIVTHADHLWGAIDRRAGRKAKTVDTAEMMAGLHHGTSRNGKPRARWLMPYTKPLQGRNVAIPFEPYFLGLWLGDGAASCGRISGSPEDNAHCIKELEARGHRIGAQHTQDTGTHYFSVLSDKPKGQGVIGYFRGKRVPDEYMSAPIRVRRDLLAGLVDSDGSVESGGRVRFVNTNRDLIDGCAELARGLGYRASISSSAPGPKGNLPSWTVQWTPHDGEPAGFLPRKSAPTIGTRRMRSVVSIEPCEPEEGHCIQIDHPSHLYLVGRQLTPTHNTTTACNGFGWRMDLDPALHHAYITYGDTLAQNKSRAIRRLARGAGVQLRGDAQNVHHWELEAGGSFLATGVGGGITGKGITGVAVIDDAHKDRQEAESVLLRDRVWDWFTDTFWTRLEDSASVIVIQCMAGDTPVLMATGQERPLRDIRPGDCIATYDNGKVSVSTVRNWINNGPDKVFKIRMKSGIVVKANARHPFLVEANGETKWERTATLKKGSVILGVTGASGQESLAQKMAATSQPSAKGCAARTTVKSDGKMGIARLPSTPRIGARGICDIAMGLTSQSSSASPWPRAESVPCASSPRRKRTPGRTGTISFASIIATTAGKFAAFFVTIAIFLWDMEKRRRSCSQPLSTCEIVRDTVAEVVEAGVEDVFDIQVDRTENFIANGLVSHNTRWHKDDLIGRVLKGFEDPETGEKIEFERIRLPAIAEEDDLLNREVGEALWPERFPLKKLAAIRSIQGPYGFASLYQQRPIAKGAQLFSDYPSRFELDKWKLDGHRVLIVCDPAASEKTSADFSAVYVMAAIGYGELMEAWLIDHYHEQVQTPQLVRVLKMFQKRYWGVAVGVEAVGGFKAVPQMLRDQEPTLKVLEIIPLGDKWIRAQPAASAWNEGRLHVPTDRDWAEPTMKELTEFSAGAKKDDRMDAVAHGWNTLYREKPPKRRRARRDRQRPFG